MNKSTRFFAALLGCAFLFAFSSLTSVVAQVTDANNANFENADTKDREAAKSQSSPSDSEDGKKVKSGGFEFTIDAEVLCSPVRSQGPNRNVLVLRWNIIS